MTDPRQLLAGAGGVPPTPFIVRVRADVKVGTDLTIGTGYGAKSGEDIEIARDPVTGRPVWLGTSQAGALRHLSATHYGERTAAVLFGTSEDTSLVHTQDALAYRGSDLQVPETSRRVGNRHDTARSVVETGALFDMETVQPGTYFRVDWTLHLIGRAEGDAKILAAFFAVLELFETDGVHVGHRKGKGRGELQSLRWLVDTYDLVQGDDYRKWVERERDSAQWQFPHGAASTVMNLFPIVPGPLAGWRGKAPAKAVNDDLTFRFCLLVQEDLDGAMFDTTMAQSEPVLAGPAVADGKSDREVREPDRRPFTRAHAVVDGGEISVSEVPLNSGEAFHSVLKRAARWALSGVVAELSVARATPDTDERAERLFVGLFGGENSTGRIRFSPSRVTVTEEPFVDFTQTRMTHVAIDPLTQGARKGALFSEDVLVGGRTSATVTVKKPSSQEIALIFLALRDINDGFGPTIGHGGTNGHGRFRIDGANTTITTGTTPPSWGNWIQTAKRRNNLNALVSYLQGESS